MLCFEGCRLLDPLLRQARILMQTHPAQQLQPHCRNSRIRMRKPKKVQALKIYASERE